MDLMLREASVGKALIIESFEQPLGLISGKFRRPFPFSVHCSRRNSYPITSGRGGTSSVALCA